MKILKLSPYCYPEQVSSSHMTNDLNQAFADAGFIIETYVPMPSRGISNEVRRQYKSKRDETLLSGHYVIHRFSMIKEGKNSFQRAVKYVLTNITQYWKGSRAQNVDVIYAASTPPTQGFLCAKVKKRLSKRYGYQVPFVFNLQDVFPDSLVNAKMTKKGSLIWKIGRKIEDYTYRNADKIITISEDFKANIMAKGVPEEKIVVVPNWVNTDNVYPVKREDNILFDRYGLDRSLFYICYSGNIGLSQNMDMLLDVAKEIDLPDVRFVLIGEGAAKEEVQRRIDSEGINNVIMLPFQDYSEIAYVFSLGDVGLIISKPGVGGSSVPSKTFSIMAAERPILASFDEGSELCKLIKEIGCGIVSDAKSKDAFVKAVVLLKQDADKRRQAGLRGKKYLTENLDKDKCTHQYIEVIKEAIH